MGKPSVAGRQMRRIICSAVKKDIENFESPLAQINIIKVNSPESESEVHSGKALNKNLNVSSSVYFSPEEVSPDDCCNYFSSDNKDTLLMSYNENLHLERKSLIEDFEREESIPDTIEIQLRSWAINDLIKLEAFNKLLKLLSNLEAVQAQQDEYMRDETNNSTLESNGLTLSHVSANKRKIMSAAKDSSTQESSSSSDESSESDFGIQPTTKVAHYLHNPPVMPTELFQLHENGQENVQLATPVNRFSAVDKSVLHRLERIEREVEVLDFLKNLKSSSFSIVENQTNVLTIR
ncbi:unnamed protein product [Allacma fusca]|uniref:Uncharacterized protein n=1 Tax=Allacma fusca TaxID=39272 RepID=A0A8J2L0Z1_9HEXA|nr:unnamed protein product [Allacma fusca]